jgi:amino acid transporter
MGINFFVIEAIFVPFEMVAINVMLRFWTDKIPIAVVVVIVLFAYG